MAVHTKILKFKTKKYLEFVDLTDKVEAFLKKLAVRAGTVTVFSRHTTLAVRVNEREKGLMADFTELIDKLIPKKKYYRHNDLSIRTENLTCSSSGTDCPPAMTLPGLPWLQRRHRHARLEHRADASDPSVR